MPQRTILTHVTDLNEKGKLFADCWPLLGLFGMRPKHAALRDELVFGYIFEVKVRLSNVPS